MHTDERGFYKDLSNLEIKLIDFCDKHSLVNEKNIIVSHNNDNEQTIESILTGQSLAQIKIQEQEFEECFKVIKGAELKGKIIASDSKKGVECYYSDSRQYEEYYSKNSSVIKSLKGRVLAVVEDKQGMIKNDLIFTTQKIYIATKTWPNPDLKVKCGKDYNEVRVSAKSSTLEDISGYKLYNQAQKEIDYIALADMLHQLKKVTEKYNTKITESGSCECIMQTARTVAIKVFGRGISEARSQSLLTTATRHTSKNDSYATVLKVQKAGNGTTLTVKIHRGSFSIMDQVEILKSDGDATWPDTICYIYGNNQQLDRADQGLEVMFYFENMPPDCADVGSEIKII